MMQMVICCKKYIITVMAEYIIRKNTHMIKIIKLK